MQLEIESFSYPKSEPFVIPNPNAWDVSDTGTTALGVQGTQLRRLHALRQKTLQTEPRYKEAKEVMLEVNLTYQKYKTKLC